MQLSVNNNLIKNNTFKSGLNHGTKQNFGTLSTSQSSPSFCASYEKIIENGLIKYTNFDKIQNQIDGVLGSDRYFSSLMKKAGIGEIQENTLELKKTSLLGDLWETMKYPFKDMPFDILNSLVKSNKKTKLNNFARKISQNDFVQKQFQRIDKEKNYALVRDILEQYTNAGEKGNLFSCTQGFSKDTASKITKVTKNYSSRDERTLNRAITAIVSAVYSGWDFYNISMLQTNDRDKASAAEKSRLKQELTRMAITTGLTFLTLGALEKYVKSNIFLNAGVIAMSTLISEVGSRIANGTPLHPLSPAAAAKLAQENPELVKENKEQKEEKQQSSFFDKNKYSKFYANDVSPSVSRLEKESFKEKTKDMNKKKMSLGTKILIASAMCSATFLSGKILSGEYAKKIKIADIYNKNKELIDDYLAERTFWLKDDVLDQLKVVAREADAKAEKLSFFDKFKKSITTTQGEINVKKVTKMVSDLSASDEGGQVNSILNVYLKHAKQLSDSKVEEFKTYVDKPLQSGIYNGLTKLVQTIYTILSAPVQLLDIAIQRKYKKTDSIFKNLQKEIPPLFDNKYKETLEKELTCLKQVIDDNTTEKADSKAKIVEYIMKNSRNFETGAETSTLANLSRTMVTAITAYFFVNDYSNKVLVESAGKDVEGAKQVRNERLMHKVFNFVINGTLMNLFNSIWIKQLNSSLVNATIIPCFTEMCNEALIRKSICQPIGRMESAKAIMDYEQDQLDRKGIAGAWTRTFKKLTGKKNLTQKAGIKTPNSSKQKTKTNKVKEK